MAQPHVATVFVYNNGDVLLSRDGREERPNSRRWTTFHSRIDGNPERTARELVRGLSEVNGAEFTLGHAGEPFPVSGPAGDAFPGAGLDGPVTVHPFRFDCRSRNLRQATGTGRPEWTPPIRLLEKGPSPLWRAFDRVRPTVETVAGDTTHGSAFISVRALAVLRDEAAILRSDRPGDYGSVEEVARDLLRARPSMTAVTNRINRVMATPTGPIQPATAQQGAQEGIERALRADSEAAEAVAPLLEGKRTATLSRSGTVLDALRGGHPEAVLVAHSRPGGEGIETAKAIHEATAVTITSDAAFAAQLADWNAEHLLVGADSILADGRVVNKVGTRGAAIAASREGVPVIVAAASDKIRPDTSYDLEPRDGSELYDGDVDLAIANPTFDVTPAACIDSLATERGQLDAAAIERIANEHGELAEWDHRE